MSRLLSAFLPRLPVPRRRGSAKPRRRVRPRIETLEERVLLYAVYNPVQIRHAYGFDRVGFEDATHALVAGDGRGMTIGIVDVGDEPNIAGDLATFDSAYGLPAPPSFTRVDQNGGTNYPPPAPGNWPLEIALDVEYAHAMAPAANILLVEANTYGNYPTAVQTAANRGAVAISMSFGGGEYNGETGLDGTFSHAGTTYMAATGDSGAPGAYPAYSYNVVAVGGTSLYLDSNGEYQSESGWGGSGGGISQYEPQPGYQNGVVDQWSTTRRTIPDLAFDASDATRVSVYESYNGAWWSVFGTSVASPIMSGLTAIIDQGRSYLFGRPSYNSTDFLNALYHLPQSDLNDITTGNNGFPAGPGYDLVTGRGTPIVDRFVSGMIGAPVYDPLDGSLLVTGGGRGSNDIITLSQSGSQLVVQVSAGTPVAGSGVPANQTFFYNAGQYNAVTVSTGDGFTTVNVQNSTPVTLNLADHGNTTVNVGTDHNTVNLWENSTNATTEVVGGSSMAVNLGRNGSVQNIAGFVDLLNPPSYSAITVDDSADPGSRGVTLNTVLLGGGPYGRITGLAPGTIDFKYADTSSILIETGTGTVNVFVLATGFLGNGTGGTTFQGNSFTTTVNVGNGNCSNILGNLTITNPLAESTVIVADSTDGNNDTVWLDTVALGGSSYGRIRGLSAGTIYYKYADTSSIAVRTGTGTEVVNVLATGFLIGATTVEGHSANTTVNVGNNNSLAAIVGTLTITNPPSWTHVTINDSADVVPHANVVLTATSLTGLAPAAIDFGPNDLAGLSILGGTGTTTYTIANTQRSGGGNVTTLDAGTGSDTVNVQGTAGPLTLYSRVLRQDVVNLGLNNSLSGINGAVTLNLSGFFSDFNVNVNDSADGGPHPNVALSAGSLTGLSPAAINFSALLPVNTLTINGGNGGTTYTIGGAPNSEAVTNLNLGAGANTVNVQGTGQAPLNITSRGFSVNDVVNFGLSDNLAGIVSPVTIVNSASSIYVNVNDQIDGTNHTDVEISGGSLTGLAPAAINFVNLSYRLTVNAGSGNDTFTLTGSQAPFLFGVVLNLGTGNTLVNVQGATNSLAINNVSFAGGPTVVNVGLNGSLAGILMPVTIVNSTPRAFVVHVDDFADGTAHPNVVLSATGLTGLAPAAINYTSSQLSSLLVRTGSGGATVHVSAMSTGTALVGNAAGTNTLVGPNAATTWNINAQNAGNLAGLNLSFSAFQNLTGGSLADDFVFNGAGVDGTLDGGGGANTLDESAYGAPVTVDLTADSATGVGVGFANVRSFVGSAGGGNTLDGPAAATTWNLSGSDAGTLSGGFAFTAFGNLNGGTGNNTFVIGSGGSLDGTLNGGAGGTNTLDYSAYTASVIVDLQTGLATAVAGGVSNVVNVNGANGSGPGLYNLLIGNGGNVLTGGTGRVNLLVAGGSASTLVGGTAVDLLVGGTTNFDTEPGLPTWQMIAAYWASTSDDLPTRENTLAGDGLVVTGNGGGNTMSGNNGPALIYTDGADAISGFDPSSIQVPISP
jgi:hypothetical protein